MRGPSGAMKKSPQAVEIAQNGDEDCACRGGRGLLGGGPSLGSWPNSERRGAAFRSVRKWRLTLRKLSIADRFCGAPSMVGRAATQPRGGDPVQAPDGEERRTQKNQ